MSPYLHPLLEKLVEAFLCLASLLLDVPECTQGSILIPTVFLYKPILSFLEDGQALLIDFGFLNGWVSTSWLMEETDLRLLESISL